MPRTDTTFKTGQSGNPSGRPAGFAQFKSLCREKAAEALERIEALAKGGRGISKGVQLEANKYIVDQGWGKPTQAIAGDPERPPIQLETMVAALQEADRAMGDERGRKAP